MLVLKTLLNIGMDKIVPPKHSRRHSTGNLAFEYTDVVSRYLKDPVSTCHDNCKQLDTTTPERLNRTPSTSKKLFTSIIPKLSTKTTNNTSLVKNQIKPLPNEPIKRDFLKSKSKNNDPFYILPSRTHRRRYSEIILPTGGLEDVLDPDPPPIPGFTRPTSRKKIDSKIESRKDPKSIPIPKPISVENGNISKKVPTLRTQTSLPNLAIDQTSRKSKPVKPVGEPVQEKTEKTHSQTSNERETENGCNEATTPKKDETLRSHDRNNGCNEASTSKKNETLKSHDQTNGVGGKKRETSRSVGKLNGDNSSQKMKFKQGKIVDGQSSCSSQRKLKFRQQMSGEKNENEDNNKVNLRRLCSDSVLETHNHESSIKSVNVVLNKSVDVEKNKKRHSGLNNVIEETASKLIQTRKSRVQALVGAFEMISDSNL